MPTQAAGRRASTFLTTEFINEAAAKLKEARDHYRSEVDDRHNHIFSVIGKYFNLSSSDVEEALLEDIQMCLLDDFFIKDGKETLFVYYCESSSFEGAMTVETIRIGGGGKARRKKVKIVDTTSPLSGEALFFHRLNTNTAITVKNITTEVFCVPLDTSKNFLNGFMTTMASFYTPILEHCDTGNTNLTESLKSKYLRYLQDFYFAMESAEICMNEKVILKESSQLELHKFRDIDKMKEGAKNVQILAAVEEIASMWMKQITTEINEIELVRVEKENDGPHTEVRYWKKRMTRFNSLLDQLKSKDVLIVYSMLRFANSATLQPWVDLDKQVTEAFNEAKENVKYLKAIEKYCSPLYHKDIEKMKECIPKLIHSLSMIYVYSTYYNTFSNMTVLFVKITNQMISSCKGHITESHSASIWLQDPEEILKKIDNCVNLNEAYQRIYRETRSTMVEKRFDFSEMRIFGNFNLFVKRLLDIRTVVDKIRTYSVLKNITLEGKDPIVSKLVKITNGITCKEYDYLDQRSSNFEPDFEEYISKMDELHQSLLHFINTHFEKTGSTMYSLRLMEKFEKITIPDLQHEARYVQLFHNFRQEIEMVATMYMENKDNPMIDRNMPPMSGRIQWARNLYRRLEIPMQVFLVQAPFLFTYKEGHRIVSRYNKVCEVLTAYEILIHRAWVRRVKKVTTGLKASILSWNEEKHGHFIVNLDPEIVTLFREVECMERLKFEIPPVAAEMKLRSASIKRHYQLLDHLVHEHERIMERVNPEFERLLLPRLYKIYRCFEPGLTIYNWRSLNILEFTKNVNAELQSFEMLLNRANDVRENQITEMLDRMSSVNLCALPQEDEHWTVRKFLEMGVIKVIEGAEELKALSISVLDSVHDFCDILMEDFDKLHACYKTNEPEEGDSKSAETKTTELSVVQQHAQFFNDRQLNIDINKTQKLIVKLEFAVDELMRNFAQRTVDCVIKAVRGSLENLWRFASCRDITVRLKDTTLLNDSVIYIEGVKPQTLFSTDVRLVDNNLQIVPSLEDIQRAIRKASQLIIFSSKTVEKWNDEKRVPVIMEEGGVPRRVSRKRVTSYSSNLSDPDTMLEMKRPSRMSVLGSVRTMGSIFSEEPETNVRKKGTSTTYEDYQKRIAMLEELTAAVNCFSDVRHDREVYKLHTFLQSCVNNMRKVMFLPDSQLQELKSFTAPLEKYQHLWKVNLETEIAAFMDSDPSLLDFQAKFTFFDELQLQLNQEPDRYIVGALKIDTTSFKITMSNRLTNFVKRYTLACIEKYLSPMEKIYSDIEQNEIGLKRNLITLDDIAASMDTLRGLRETAIETDNMMILVEDTYAVLHSHQLPVSKDMVDRVEAMRYNYDRLIVYATSVMDHILSIQGNYRDDLVANINEMKRDVCEFERDYDESGPMIPGVPPREASDRQILFKNRFDNLYRRYESYRRGEKLFGLEVTEYDRLLQIGKELDLLQRLYGLYNEVNRTVTGYYEIVWSNVDMEQISDELTEFQNKCKRLPSALRNWNAYTELKKTIDDFNDMVPLLEMMTNKAMKARHWQRLQDLTSYIFDVESEEFTLKNMLDAPLLIAKEDVEDICISAVRETDIEAKLKSVANEWSAHDLKTANFKNRGELLLKSDVVSEVNTCLEDSLMLLSSLMSNRYNVPFKRSIGDWMFKLTTCSEVLENWMRVQNLWVYLEAVFVGGDIAKQMPQEAKRFQNIDKSWVKIMERARDTSNVVQCCAADQSLTEILPRLLEHLEMCQKSLTGYLEKKRLSFPRFFFVSDPVLLEILGQSSDSHSIQAHLLSIFDNIAYAKFNEKSYNVMEECFSQEDEMLALDKPVYCEGHVESWLATLLFVVQQSLSSIIRKAYFCVCDPELDMIEFLDDFPAQVGILGIQLIWTHDSTEALREAKADKHVMVRTNKSFLQLLNVLINQTTKDLEKYQRTKFETLITIHVHQRDIFDEMCRQNVRSLLDFEWTKQTRTYFIENLDVCLISITDVDFQYQNEFLGCTDRLVITPLTDRCYITLAQALSMSLGGAPAGPAGTGKTETTKDMGRCLGKYVVVFNCSDQMDFRGLGRIIKGLAQSGSWGCFDEFNRIELPVLSVAAQQIAVVLACKRERKKSFVFLDGDVVTCNPEFGLFLTMNPGYAGRQELPENLKINFRSVAMMIPDRQIIIRVKLASCGFINNIILSRKFFVLYKLCEEQLTKQVHYDFGLRNILSVLRTLGAAKRANPNDPEERVVMKGLRDMNVSKLVDQDEPLFLSLINDLFPGIVLDAGRSNEIEVVVKKQIEAHKCIPHPAWFLKVIQLYETQRVRHGMMTLGPSGAGKTCCINVLMASLTEIGFIHKEMRMNPKAITASQMFGRLDVATNDWTDGIFSTLWRRTLKMKKGEHTWLVLDGPVDAIWIENLNSVLDDTKKLTLANGDRIPMAPTCKIIFEVHNIDNASPATVSRNGMVFMSSSALDWNPLVKAWLLQHPEIDMDVAFELFTNTFQKTLTYAREELEFKMEFLDAFFVHQCCKVLGGLYAEHHTQGARHLERLYVMALMWSVGALLELDGRSRMEAFLRDNTSLDLPTCENDEKIFDFYVDKNSEWVHWNERVEEYIYPKDSIPNYISILVPNVDNVRTEFLLDCIAKQSKGVLLLGEAGSAKTVIITKYLNKYNPEAHIQKSLNFSSATTPEMFQRTIESFIEKRVGSTFGPPAGKKMTVFIDDINLPVINEWGDQIGNEIVRQLMENGGFYNLEKPGDFTHVVDIQFIGAMNHPGGGRNDIPERLKRQLSVFNCTLPSNASIDKIFSVIGCGYYATERGFSPETVETVEKLVPITRVIWQITKNRMLPTPAKFHYVFNLRDLSRIWQGMCISDSEVITCPKDVVSLWHHEFDRVIADRFINEDDIEWFRKTMTRVTLEQMPDFPLLEEILSQECLYVDFMRNAPQPTGDEPEDFDFCEPKIYEMVQDTEDLRKRLIEKMTSLNESIRGSPMNLVFFRHAIHHLVRISRIIRFPRGNALLVGVGGSGKQSLTRLASYIAGFKTFQITLTRTYNVNNLLEDLKVLYRIAGVEGKGMTFIFTDNDIADEAFLEYLNNIIASGIISNLFAKDEMEEMCGQLIPVMKKEFPRLPATMENLSEYFVTRVKHNLHVVLCFSPMGEKFRSRSLKFPSLTSGCTIDWFQSWPEDALLAVADYYLTGFPMIAEEQVKEDLVKLMAGIHFAVSQTCVDYFKRYRRMAHVTPKSYLSFLQSYQTLYTKHRNHIQELASRMDSGLMKLVEATQSVAELSVELEKMEKELAIANEEANTVLENVMKETAAAEEVKNKVLTMKEKAKHIVDSIDKDKAVAEEKLCLAEPALLEAEEALNTIKPADISTVRKLAKPPHLIQRIMDCVVILFQKKLDQIRMDPEKPCPKPSWGESLKLLSQTTFLSNLLQFPRDSIIEETVELVNPYFEMEDYTLENAKKVCGNVAGLLSWTLAMKKFYYVNKEVVPLKDNLAKANVRLQKAYGDLAVAEELLAEKEAVLKVVREMYESAMKKKQDLADAAEKCRFRMSTASQLISGLGGERVRWTEQSQSFKTQIVQLVGDVLLCTGFLSYAGPFNQTFRTKLMNSWMKEINVRQIPVTEGLEISNILVDQPTISEWNLQGLPNDELSIQNGIIVTKACRYPLIIDPQGQGKNWIINREKSNQLIISNFNNRYFRNHLEDALSQGRPLLMEDICEDLDPALDDVLERNFIKIGRTYKVKVGDKEVDIDVKNFRIYMTTKIANPSYTPEISARTSIIDFTVTIKGLEDQLLGRVIDTEKEELEKSRIKLAQDMMTNKRRVQDLEDNLLERLANTQGSLVDDQDLLVVLQDTKVTSTEVEQMLALAMDTEKEINTAREEYRPVATRGSILYFLITEMSFINPMYQTGLKQFLHLFDISMLTSDKSPITQRRIGNIIECMTFVVWKFSVRGLYTDDKITLTLLLALKIDLNAAVIRHEEFDILIKGGSALNLGIVEPKPAKWITDMTWLNLVALSNLYHFSGIQEQIERNEKLWKHWFDKDAPEEEPVPGGYENLLDTFRRLLLIRCWCPDRTLPQAKKYIADSLGNKFADSLILDLEELYRESTCRTPLLCLLSMGSDPTNMIEAMGKKLKVEVRQVSMGQGQEVHARRHAQSLMANGGWLLLQNCHLSLSYVEELFLQITETDKIHEGYRLWITTEVHASFPINFLQIAIKFTNEPPQGIKSGLRRTFADFTQDFLDTCYTFHWKIMLYTLAFLHTTVQERRKFGPLGWNIPYEFNQSDFFASVEFLQNHLDSLEFKKAQKTSGIDWKCVRYMLSEIQYGGRVTDDYDKRLLITIVNTFFFEGMFLPEFQFLDGYTAPLYATIDEYHEHIGRLHHADTPEVMGLHPNADITYQTKTTANILDTILEIQPKESSMGSGETREATVYRLSSDMLTKLPPYYVRHVVEKRLNDMGPLQPMNIFLRQEVDRMQKVIKMVGSTLTDMKLSIDGSIIMNENLRDALDCIYDAKIPRKWQKISWDSTSLGFWFAELIDRNSQFSSWLSDGRPPAFWMTGFFNPQGFLTAMRQEVTRQHEGWALDTVVLNNRATRSHKEDIKEPPKDGVFVYGLFLEGAGWDKRNLRLVESKPKVLFDAMTVINIFAIQESTKVAKDKEKTYQCPIYKKPRRTDLTYVSAVDLNCSKTASHWVMRGVALLCDIK